MKPKTYGLREEHAGSPRDNFKQIYLKTTSAYYRRKNAEARDTSVFAVLRVMKRLVR